MRTVAILTVLAILIFFGTVANYWIKYWSRSNQYVRGFLERGPCTDYWYRRGAEDSFNFPLVRYKDEPERTEAVRAIFNSRYD